MKYIEDLLNFMKYFSLYFFEKNMIDNLFINFFIYKNFFGGAPSLFFYFIEVLNIYKHIEVSSNIITTAGDKAVVLCKILANVFVNCVFYSQ